MANTQLKAGLNYAFMHKYYDPSCKNKQGFLLQGSGGSGKTFDVIFFILTYCTNNSGVGKDILITRETYSACKKTVLKDFIKILKQYGIYDKDNHIESHPQKYIFEGNTISFAGRDDSSSHGDRNDLIYFNEIMLDEDDKAYQQLNGRCREIFICDYNPKYTEHWVYDKIKRRKDVKFLKTTFLTNKFLPEGERQEKLGYEPWHPEDRSLPIEKRRPHPVNIEQGTADEYLWRVYGLGEAAAAEGIIFEHATWIDKFPDYLKYIYVMDFGFTVDPCYIGKYAEDDKNIWIEPLCYHPIETPGAIHDFATGLGLNPKIQTIADSSDKHRSEKYGSVEMVKGLKKLGWNIRKVRKNQSVIFWINSMKKKKIHIVKNHLFKEILKEKENYRMKTINGIAVNQPIDKWNHHWDGSRYGHMFWNTPGYNAFW